MQETVYIFSEGKGRNTLKILMKFAGICVSAGFQPFIRQFDDTPDDPDFSRGEVIECRMDKLPSSKLLIVILDKHTSKRVYSELRTAHINNIPIFISCKKHSHSSVVNEVVNMYMVYRYDEIQKVFAEIRRILGSKKALRAL